MHDYSATKFVSRQVLKERMQQSDQLRTTISFYKYFPINELDAFRTNLLTGLEKLKVLGRIYIAQEGINAQISVPTAKQAETCVSS